MFKLVFRTALVTHIDIRGIEPRAELARTTDEIGVNMRFENVRDRYLRLTRHVDVNVAIRSRVEDRGDPLFVIAQKIRKLSDPFGLDRFKNERHPSELTRASAEVQPPPSPQSSPRGRGGRRSRQVRVAVAAPLCRGARPVSR